MQENLTHVNFESLQKTLSIQLSDKKEYLNRRDMWLQEAENLEEKVNDLSQPFKLDPKDELDRKTLEALRYIGKSIEEYEVEQNDELGLMSDQFKAMLDEIKQRLKECDEKFSVK